MLGTLKSTTLLNVECGTLANVLDIASRNNWEPASYECQLNDGVIRGEVYSDNMQLTITHVLVYVFVRVHIF
jgi:hypothetical protein